MKFFTTKSGNVCKYKIELQNGYAAVATAFTNPASDEDLQEASALFERELNEIKPQNYETERWFAIRRLESKPLMSDEDMKAVDRLLKAYPVPPPPKDVM